MPQFNPRDTIISQYANSPTLVQLIDNMGQYIDPTTDFKNFYDFVWNIETAQSWGLDILGRIVNVSRQITVPGAITNFGFSEGVNYSPFGQAPFYTGVVSSDTYLLTDDAYRTLIRMKALLNISDNTAPSINQLLRNLFAGRGRCYVVDTGQMQMRLVFEFPLLSYEIAILKQSNVVPRPAGVLVQVMQPDYSGTFGFSEGKVFQPFGSGSLFNSTAGSLQPI